MAMTSLGWFAAQTTAGPAAGRNWRPGDFMEPLDWTKYELRIAVRTRAMEHGICGQDMALPNSVYKNAWIFNV